jgi:penicillin-binding protein 2
MNQEKARSLVFTRRAALLGGGQVLLLSALVGRMYQLQIVESDRYTVMSRDNQLSDRLLEPLRGRILDRFGISLAENDHNYRVEVTPEKVGDLKQVLEQLALFVPLTDEDRAAILADAKKRRSFVPIAVSENLSWHQLASIEVNAPDLPGVSIEVGQRRRYTQGRNCSHIIGYVAVPSEKDLTSNPYDPLLELPGFRIGKSGVEKQYDESLRGKQGMRRVEVDAVGRVVDERVKERIEPTPGQDLVLTLDIGLQQFVQQRLASELSASAVVLDAQTGDVLALGSTPSYDPSMFTRGVTVREWQDLMSDPLRPLANKATGGEYAPGSTFKMMVALAALKRGIDPNRHVFCPGVYSVGNTNFHCWKKGGHGSVDMYNAHKYSCDVFFYDTAMQTGIDNIAEMARQFGFGALTGIDIPGERHGLIPDSSWKQATYGEPWYPGETPSAGIGQGFITATPLQLAVMAARVGSGRAIVPHFRRAAVVGAAADTPAVDEAAALDIPERHFEVVREGMRRVVNDAGGTAFRARIAEPGMEMAAKTGTAQVRHISMSEHLSGVRKNQDLPWQQRDHALFVCFAPVGAPRYALSVVVEHGGGGSAVAGPIAHDIMLETQRRNPARANLGQKLAMTQKS